MEVFKPVPPPPTVLILMSASNKYYVAAIETNWVFYILQLVISLKSATAHLLKIQNNIFQKILTDSEL